MDIWKSIQLVAQKLWILTNASGDQNALENVGDQIPTEDLVALAIGIFWDKKINNTLIKYKFMF